MKKLVKGFLLTLSILSFSLALPSCSPTIIKGQQGETGPMGEQGEKGEDGEDGSIWLTGDDVPSSSLGKDNDMYLNTSTNDVYQKQNGTWVLVTNIQGEQGEQGEPGKDGEDGEDGKPGQNGPQGPQGPQGPAGEDSEDAELDKINFLTIKTYTNSLISTPQGYITSDKNNYRVGEDVILTVHDFNLSDKYKPYGVAISDTVYKLDSDNTTTIKMEVNGDTIVPVFIYIPDDTDDFENFLTKDEVPIYGNILAIGLPFEGRQIEPTKTITLSNTFQDLTKLIIDGENGIINLEKLNGPLFNFASTCLVSLENLFITDRSEPSKTSSYEAVVISSSGLYINNCTFEAFDGYEYQVKVNGGGLNVYQSTFSAKKAIDINTSGGARINASKFYYIYDDYENEPYITLTNSDTQIWIFECNSNYFNNASQLAKNNKPLLKINSKPENFQINNNINAFKDENNNYSNIVTFENEDAENFFLDTIANESYLFTDTNKYIQDISIEDFLALDPNEINSDITPAYRIKGYITGWYRQTLNEEGLYRYGKTYTPNKYANFYLADSNDLTKEIVVYGSSPVNENNLIFSESGCNSGTDGSYVENILKKSQTMPYEIGNCVTVIGTFNTYSDKNQLKGAVVTETDLSYPYLDITDFEIQTNINNNEIGIYEERNLKISLNPINAHLDSYLNDIDIKLEVDRSSEGNAEILNESDIPYTEKSLDNIRIIGLKEGHVKLNVTINSTYGDFSPITKSIEFDVKGYQELTSLEDYYNENKIDSSFPSFYTYGYLTKVNDDRYILSNGDYSIFLYKPLLSSNPYYNEKRVICYFRDVYTYNNLLETTQATTMDFDDSMNEEYLAASGIDLNSLFEEQEPISITPDTDKSVFASLTGIDGYRKINIANARVSGIYKIDDGGPNTYSERNSNFDDFIVTLKINNGFEITIYVSKEMFGDSYDRMLELNIGDLFSCNGYLGRVDYDKNIGLILTNDGLGLISI